MDDELQGLLGESQQDELWLISYADLLTLLIAFFLLLIAASPLKLSRFERIAASLSGSAPAPLVDLKAKVDQLIEEQSLSGKVNTREDAEGLGIELKDALLFDSGSTEVRPEGQRVIADVAKLMRELKDRTVIIEGHTDDLPIRTPQFQSNWDLSSKRAITVLGALEQSGVPRERMSVRGYAETRPVAGAGAIDERRTASRRVVIRVE